MFRLVTIVPLWVAYLALTGNWELRNWVVGLLVALGITALVRPKPRPIAWRLLPVAAVAAAGYAAALFIDLVRSGIQVTRLVLSPRPHLRPGIIAVPSGLASKRAQALSAHAITVTPGELVVESDDDGVLYVHVLDVDSAEDATPTAQARRRRLLERAFTPLNGS